MTREKIKLKKDRKQQYKKKIINLIEEKNQPTPN